MSHPLTFDRRLEVSSSGELWPIVLGALFATALFAGALRFAAWASAPFDDDELAYRSAEPVLRAAERPEPPRRVVVAPEPPFAVTDGPAPEVPASAPRP